MDDSWWPWILSAVGVTGFILVGKKIWWAWYVNVACQFLWLTYSIVTHQFGFLVAVIVYFSVFSRNAYVWTREHYDPYYGFDFNEVAMPDMDPERPAPPKPPKQSTWPPRYGGSRPRVDPFKPEGPYPPIPPTGPGAVSK